MDTVGSLKSQNFVRDRFHKLPPMTFAEGSAIFIFTTLFFVCLTERMGGVGWLSYFERNGIE